jgi:hypothetical protein
MHRTLVGKPERKWEFLRQRKGLKNNITLDLKEIGCDIREIHGTGSEQTLLMPLISATLNLRVLLPYAWLEDFCQVNMCSSLLSL